MNIEIKIGDRIRSLRTQKGMSQAELAEFLHISAQSVSKWENDTSLPDINQLPAIASFFGVSIDELFAYPTNLEYERIENAIDNGYTFSNDQFIHSEGFLLEEIRRNPANHKAVSMLADLYHFHACRLNDKAAHYAVNALSLKPDNKTDLNTLNNASGGCIVDWSVANHESLIEKLKKLAYEGPDRNRTKLYLMDNLILDGRIDEAKALLEELREAGAQLVPVYELRIKEQEMGFKAVEQQYESLIREETNENVLFDTANRLAFNRSYDLSIRAYEMVHAKSAKPRYTDMLESIALLYVMKGDNAGALDAYQRELKLLSEEWNITKGAQVDILKENIRKLSGKAL